MVFEGTAASFQRQAHHEFGSAPQRGFDGNHTAVPLHNALRDRQTESRATRAARAHFIGSPEPIEDMRQVVFSDSDPAVAHDGVYFGAGSRQTECNLPAFRGV